MWPQIYTPIENNLPLSALVAALPVFVLLFLLGVLRKPAWIASLSGLAAAGLVALAVYRMPATLVVSSALYGAAYGLLPIGWIVFTAILLYRLTVETGKFEIIKDSIGSLTGDQRLQALLIAFAFSGFIEGAAGFGTPVAVAAAMLTGLGFTPFFAATLCLLGNTVPVAFGSIGTPLVMLQTVTQLPMKDISSDVGRICAPLSLFMPAYVILVMGGIPALRAVAPAAIVCGVAFAGGQFFVSNFVGPYLTGILSALLAIGALIALFKVWKPKDAVVPPPHRHTRGNVLMAWAPYGFLVIIVLLWGNDSVKAFLDRYTTLIFAWPGSAQSNHAAATRYPASFTVRGQVYPEFPVGVWNIVSVRRVCIGDPAAGIARETGKLDLGHRPSTRAPNAHDRQRDGFGVSHELFGSYDERSDWRWPLRARCFPSSARCSDGWACSSRAAILPPTDCSALFRWLRRPACT